MTIKIFPLICLLALPLSSAAAGVRDVPHDLVAAGRIFVEDTAAIAASPLHTTPRQALAWGGILGLTLVAYNNDEGIRREVQDSSDGDAVQWFRELGDFFEPVGHMGVMNKIWFGGLAVSYVAGEDRATRIFAEILEAHFIAGLAKNVTQSFAGRARPHEDRGSESWGNDGATSFPSGHALNIFEIATVLSHHVGRNWFTVGAYTIAASVGVQRIRSDAHWASDVVLSAAVGTAVARSVVLRHDARRDGPSLGMTVTPGGPGLAVAWTF